jgi:hypothetical protein
MPGSGSSSSSSSKQAWRLSKVKPQPTCRSTPGSHVRSVGGVRHDRRPIHPGPDNRGMRHNQLLRSSGSLDASRSLRRPLANVTIKIGETAMFDRLERIHAHTSPLRRALLLWVASGALVHACLPALHAATTPVGPAALWLWLLPLAALSLDLVIAPAARTRMVIVAPPVAASLRRRRPSATATRSLVSRRDRPRPAVKVPPGAPRVRRAG